MSDRRNLPSPFEDICTGLQARAILDVLAIERVTNARLLMFWLSRIGLAASSHQLAQVLERMERDGLVRLEQVDDFAVIHLRRLGGEVASGLESRDWIAKSELLE